MFIKKNPVSMDILASGQPFPDALTRKSRTIGEKVEDDIPVHVDTAIRKCSQFSFSFSEAASPGVLDHLYISSFFNLLALM
jgi:hypothetical protein